MTTPPCPLSSSTQFLEVDMDKSEVCLVNSVRRSGWSSKYIVIHQSSYQISATATLFWINGENKGKKSRGSTKKATACLPRWPHPSFHPPTLKLGKGPAQGSWWETWTLGRNKEAFRGSRHCFSSQCNLEVFGSESGDHLTTTFTFWIISCFQFALFQSIDEGAIALKALVSFKHCQRHYGPRRWLLWPVILVW